MNTKETTNLILTVKQEGKVKFAERYLMPSHRAENDRLMKEANDKMDEERIYGSFVVKGKDGLWWNDDLDWVLDRMWNAGRWTIGLRVFKGNLLEKPLAVGEKRVFTHGNLIIEAVGDDTAMTDGEIERID